MVAFERYRHGDSDREVCPDSKQPIGERVLVTEYHIVRDVVNGKREGVVDDSAQKISDDGDPEVRELTDEIARDNVKDNHGRDYELELRVRTHQLFNLRVLLCNPNMH